MNVKMVRPEEFTPMAGAVIGVDFETYDDGSCSVKDLGNWAYVHHPKFKAWAVAVTDGATACVCEPSAFPWDRIDGREWVSHNREFDRAVWERLREEVIGNREEVIGGGETRNAQRSTLNAQVGAGIGEVSRGGAESQRWGDGPSNWWCSAAACAFLQFPRDLAGACKAVLGVEVDKGVRDSSKGVRGCGVPTLFDLDLCHAEKEYAENDAVMCLTLWQEVGPLWPAHERRLFELTCDMGRRGLCVDWVTVDEKAVELGRRVAELTAGLPWFPALSAKKFAAACRERGVEPPRSLAAGDEGFGEWAEEHAGSEPGRWAADMATIRRCGRLANVLESMRQRRKPDSRMVYELKYYGASPGRWAGGGGLNVQNFNRKETEGLDVRKCIMAAPGHVLAVADYSQIEARVLLYLAGDTDALKLLADHPEWDMYELHARATMGYRETESLKDFCERTGSGLRQLAKARVLGLGFRCGAETFVRVARVMAGLKIGYEEARRIVNEYRAQNPKIVHLWNALQAAAEMCLKDEPYEYRLPFPCTQYDPRCGRYLIYRDVAWHPLGKSLTAVVGGERVPLHGGIIAENWTQGTARDVLASAWLRCAAAGFRPVLSVHDELVFEVREETAHEDLRRITGIMERQLAWAPGLPLKADGKLMSRYGK